MNIGIKADFIIIGFAILGVVLSIGFLLYANANGLLHRIHIEPTTYISYAELHTLYMRYQKIDKYCIRHANNKILVDRFVINCRRLQIYETGKN